MTKETLKHAVAVRAWVVSVIDHEGDEAEKLKFFFDTFRSEYGHEVKRLGLQKAVTNYLQGLPSTINIEFTYTEIEKLLMSWGYIHDKSTEFEIGQETDRYWTMIAGSLVIMGRRCGACQ